jgi:hypothetical protein
MTDSESEHTSSIKQGPPFVLAGQYKSPKYWERGPKSKSGEPFAAVLHVGVGHALTNWEHVENSASLLFSQFTESPTIAADRAYGAIVGSRARHAAIIQAMNVFFDIRLQQYKKERDIYKHVSMGKEVCEILLTNYILASSRRNDIAHGITFELSVVKSGALSWFLVPATYNAAHSTHWINDDFKWRAATGMRLKDPKATIAFNKMYRKNADYIYSAKSLRILAGKFAYLHADIMAFLHTINPERFTLNQNQLHDMAKSLSELT